MRPIKPTRKAGLWTLTRFVPKGYRHVERRKVVRVSTGIRVADDPAGIRAHEAVQALNSQLEAYWRGLDAGQPVAPVSATTARAYVEQMRSRHLPAGGLDGNAIEDIARRVAALMRAGEAANPTSTLKAQPTPKPPPTAAKRGGVASSTKIALSTLLGEYEASQKVQLAKYSPDQLRRWRNGRIRAIANLKQVLGGDRYIEDISRDDALNFRDWWQDRIVAGGVKIDSANKEIGIISRMLHVLNRSKRLGLELVFKELCIEGGGYEQRAAYAVDFVQNNILADGALDGLNDEARGVVYVCAETGMRPVEIVNLTRRTIRLDCDVPHILVKPEGRVLKTDYSDRHFPLVGVALKVMRENPNGFPSYFDKSPALSATVNKYLSAHKLRPTAKHSLYSLRHTFEDRLTAVEPPEKIQAYLMGHKCDRPKYGSPPSLEQLHGWLSKIAFRAPTKI